MSCRCGLASVIWLNNGCVRNTALWRCMMMELSIQGCKGGFSIAESCCCCSCNIVMLSLYVVSVKSVFRARDAIEAVCNECACVGRPNCLRL